MRRSLAWPLAVLLALATGTVVGETRVVLTDPVPSVDDTDGTRRAVHAFYAAVNTVLRTGDVAALETSLAPDFGDHDGRTGDTTGRTEFGRALRALHAVAPGTWLSIEDLVAVGDRAMVRVALHAPKERTFLGLSLQGIPDAWPPLDVVRVVGGRVVERWADGTGTASLEPIGEVPLGQGTPVHANVALVRLALRPGERLTGAAVQARMLLLESGTLTLAVGAGAGAVRVASPAVPAGTPIAAGAEAVLQSGALVALPGTADFALRNDGPGTAVALVAEVSVPDRRRVVYPGTGPGPRAAPTRSPLEPVARLLAGELTTLMPGGEVTAGLGRVALSPGASIAGMTAPGPLLLTVASGSVAIGAAPGPVWLRTGTTGANRIERGSGAVALGSGDGAFVPTGGAIAVANSGEVPAVVLVVVLQAT